MTLNFGILLALFCAIATNLGFFYKHRGACAAPSVDIRRPLASASGLFRSRWFLVGMIVATGAWMFHVAALALAPMSVVQVVMAGGVALIAVMADRLFGMKVGRRQWWGLGCTALGLAMLALTQPATHGAHSSYTVPAMLSFEVGLFALGGLLIAGPRVGAPREHHGVMLGAAAGLLFGVSDIAIKALTGLVGTIGMAGLLTPWLLVAIAASVVAFYASARGLQDGDAIPVIAVTGTAANVSCILGGILVFGDPMPATALGIVIQATAFILVIAASAMTPAPRSAGARSATA